MGKIWKGSHRAAWIVLWVAVALVILGGVIANMAQTVGGTVVVRPVRFAGTDGTMMYGLLYRPVSATTKNPACGVLAIHGYINSHDTMDGFAIELARRGCVVLAVDQTGHGFSQPPAFANGYGGPDALAYLASLNFVRKGDITLIGHSMGGWASVIAAFSHPKDYRSLILVSSSTSTPGLEPIPGSPTFPKNTEVVEAKESEFSQLMWVEPEGKLFPQSPRMEQLFGLKQPIQVGRTYGSVSSGTARRLELVSSTHPGMTFSPAAIAYAVSWVQRTLSGVGSLNPGNQIWMWDEVGTLIALIGVVTLIFPVGQLLLDQPFYAELKQPLPEARPLRGAGWWLGLVILVAVGLLTYFPLQLLGNRWFPASALFPQTVTSGVMVWGLGNALIGLILFLLWHYLGNRRAGASAANYGLVDQAGQLEWRRIGKAALLAITILLAPYAALGFLNWAFATDARIWIFNAKVITPVHFQIALSYVLPFLAYFLMLAVLLHGQLRSPKPSLGRELLKNVAIMAGAYILFLLIEYIPLLAGGTLTTASQPLLAIIAYQFVPILGIAAAISTFFYYLTGRIYLGAILNACFLTLLMVASTATQFGVHRWL